MLITKLYLRDRNRMQYLVALLNDERTKECVIPAFEAAAIARGFELVAERLRDDSPLAATIQSHLDDLKEINDALTQLMYDSMNQEDR